MMRYFAMNWIAADQQQTHAARSISHKLLKAASGWRLAVDQAGLRAFCIGETDTSGSTLLLPGGSGVVFGTVFGRDASLRFERRTTFGRDEVEVIIGSQGRKLIEDYWGSFVSILRKPDSEEFWALRGAMSPLPCFLSEYRGVQIYFSRMEDFAALGLIRLRVDWRYVAHEIMFGNGGTRSTGVQDVSELLAGECLEIRRELRRRHLYWNPCDIAKTQPIEDPVDAARAVRATTKACVHAWASRHETIVHKLSGGLDSSIVAGCLYDSPTRPQVVCTTDYSSGADGDERHFARIVAKHTAFELVERARDLALDLTRMLDISRTAVPHFYFMELVNAQPAVTLARRLGASAIFTGSMGDVLFHQFPAMPAAADYMFNHGIRPQLFRIALDIAQHERVSIWEVLRRCFRDSSRGSSMTCERIRRDVLARYPASAIVDSTVAKEMVGNDEHVPIWLASTGHLPPGKWWQIFQMSLVAFDDPYASEDDPEDTHPLMSAPIAELCLRIPTYLHLDGGWDRAIARKAFIGDVPGKILQRTSKGGLEEYAKRVMMTNISFVREHLLDGSLVKEGLLKRREVEDALSGRPVKTSVGPGMLLYYLCIQIWIERISETNSRDESLRQSSGTLAVTM